MADLETIHQITEKLDVVGTKGVEKAFDKLTVKADDLEGGIGDASGSLKKMGADGGEAASDLSSGMLKATLTANLLTKAVDFVVGKLKEWLHHGWMVNEQIEAAKSRVQGLVMGLTDFSKGIAKGMDPVEASLRAANVAMAEFRDIGLKTATGVPQIEAAFARIEPVLAGLGKSQAAVMDLTEQSAAAAKVYGEDASQAGQIAAKAIQQGVVEGESAFAMAFKAQAQITSKMKLEDRMKRVKEVLEGMGAPVAEVTKDTAGALERWKILSDDVLQRVTFPIYEKIGQVVQGIVDFTLEHEDTLNDVVDTVSDWLRDIIGVGEGIWDTVSALWKVDAISESVKTRFSIIFGLAKGMMKAIDFVGQAFKVVGESIKVLAGEGSMGKLNVLLEGFKLKALEFSKIFLNVIKDIFDLVLPDWAAEKVPWLKDAKQGLDAHAKWFDKYVGTQEKRVAEMEKKMGMDPTTALGRRAKEKAEGLGMSKEERRSFLANLFGKKAPLINVENMNIQQDFRDQDPDAVAIEMVRTFEQLSEAAVTAIGGEATVFGPGGNY